MESIGKLLSLLGIVFLTMGLIFNLLTPNFPHIPGDIYIERPNLRIYIPVTSAIILSVVLTILFNFFRR